VREPKKIIKKKKNGKQRYTSRICGGGTPKDGELKFGTFVELADAGLAVRTIKRQREQKKSRYVTSFFSQ
jgi:hypothetical protein